MAKNIFNAIHSTLSMIHIAMKDVSSLTRDTLNLLRIICENQVPFKWRQVSVNRLPLLFFFAYFLLI